ncbi:hypothetical protein Angca_000982 [Angiostrongylus cantonensis]|nr:hypothetical protein Angca_000982 [Angiostrongylus cantonensis]
MDDAMMSSSHEGGLSVLLSACAPPFNLDDDFGIGWNFLNDDKDEQNNSLCSFHSPADSPISHLTAESYSSSFCSQDSLNLNCGSSDASFLAFPHDQLPSPLLGMPDPTTPAIDIDDQICSAAVTPTRTSTTTLNHSMLAQNSKCLSGENHCINYQSVLHFPFITVRKRIRDCSMVCWLFRTLLTSEYRALPLIAIFEIFENTNPSSAHGRHWRQSIRHCLMSSAAFVRVLTPNPRKDYVIMNEAGSWWTVHPDCEGACAEQVFRLGVAHKCPPNGSSEMIRITKHKVENTSGIFNRDTARIKHASRKIYVRRRPQERPSSVFLLSSKSSLFKSSRTAPVNPQRGDNLVVDHEEEVIDFNPSP